MKINEIVDVNQMLANYQKEVLLLIALSATPTQAYDATIGNINLVNARDLLARLGYIIMQNNELTLTDKGQNAIVNNNLLDQSGQPTPDAKTILNNIKYPNIVKSSDSFE